MRFVVKKCSQEKATGDLIVQYYKGNKWTVCANKKEVTLPKNVYYGFGATSEKGFFLLFLFPLFPPLLFLYFFSVAFGFLACIANLFTPCTFVSHTYIFKINKIK